MSKSRIVIPQNSFFKKQKNVITLSNNVINNDFVSPFTIPENEYILNIEGKQSDSPTTMTRFCASFFKKLNLHGSVVINIKNIHNVDLERNMDTDSTFSEFSTDDYINCNSLEINTKERLLCNIETIGNRQDKPSLKTLKVSANQLDLNIENMPSIEEIKILEQYNPKCSYLKITDLPNLKMLDLSNLTSINCENFVIRNINPKCQIKLNKNLEFTYEQYNPMFSGSFSKIADYNKKIKDINKLNHPKISISKLFPELTTNPITVSFEELSNRMLIYDLKKTISYCESISQNKKQTTKLNKGNEKLQR